ncbi:PAS domain-containing protein [Mesoterricola sediminis]|uniref:PAS domain-containing protein n=1 Tax=Mesoterricola sediminis TaxID=2927980 RepID=A0AA48H0S2_9BACT|nr:PAS domain-containing protein [Mesoterricola sediminis]BDU77910.1 hypothetical protein METESE_28680 [Mesoterricola sediminis]
METRDLTSAPSLPTDLLATALRILPRPILAVAGDGRVILCNEAAVSLLGCAGPGDLLGRPLPRGLEDVNLPGPRTVWTAGGLGLAVDLEAMPLGDGTLLILADASERRRRAEASAGPRVASLQGLVQGLAQEMHTPVQFLGINLGFLRHAFGRFERGLEAVQAAACDLPEHRRVILARMEEDLDLAFLRAEVPSVLGECLEGLAKVAQAAAALKHLAGAGSPASADPWEGSIHAI